MLGFFLREILNSSEDFRKQDEKLKYNSLAQQKVEDGGGRGSGSLAGLLAGV